MVTHATIYTHLIHSPLRLLLVKRRRMHLKPMSMSHNMAFSSQTFSWYVTATESRLVLGPSWVGISITLAGWGPERQKTTTMLFVYLGRAVGLGLQLMAPSLSHLIWCNKVIFQSSYPEPGNFLFMRRFTSRDRINTVPVYWAAL